ncbi:MAG: hypothetical protein M3P04_07505 [Actinomycetota bacterium]|nr:hypothetical protein [Actinomycetota bacterium]
MGGLASRDRQWLFQVSPRPVPPGAPTIFFGGVSLEFWSADCRRMGSKGLDWKQPVKGTERIRIVPGTRWLTVTSSDNTSVVWDLNPVSVRR